MRYVAVMGSGAVQFNLIMRYVGSTYLFTPESLIVQVHMQVKKYCIYVADKDIIRMKSNTTGLSSI